jgi:hypothetical protein
MSRSALWTVVGRTATALLLGCNACGGATASGGPADRDAGHRDGDVSDGKHQDSAHAEDSPSNDDGGACATAQCGQPCFVPGKQCVNDPGDPFCMNCYAVGDASPTWICCGG